MAKGPGWNAPCPCGSGRKYKLCCLAADEARERASRELLAVPNTLAYWDEPPGGYVEELDDVEDDFGLDLLPAAATDDPLVQAQNELWERFDAADYETQIALFQDALQGATLDADLAFEMLDQIYRGSRECSDVARFRALLDQLAREAPGFYELNAVFYAAWLVDAILTDGDATQLPAALEPLAREPAASMTTFLRVADQLLYFNRVAPLLDALRRGWLPLNDSPFVLDETIEEYADLLGEVTVLAHAEQAAAGHADDQRLATQLAEYLPPDLVPYFQQDAAALLGTLERTWRPRDFESPPPSEPRRRRINLLTWEWVGDLWRSGVPLGRATLAGRTLAAYQCEGASRGRSARTLLVPARRRLDRFVTSLFNILEFRVYRVGALFELLPLYLDFLQRRALITPADRRNAMADLRPLHDDVLHLLDVVQAEPAIAGAIRERWSATP
jgi:hypothetical protein